MLRSTNYGKKEPKVKVLIVTTGSPCSSAWPMVPMPGKNSAGYAATTIARHKAIGAMVRGFSLLFDPKPPSSSSLVQPSLSSSPSLYKTSIANLRSSSISHSIHPKFFPNPSNFFLFPQFFHKSFNFLLLFHPKSFYSPPLSL